MDHEKDRRWQSTTLFDNWEHMCQVTQIRHCSMNIWKAQQVGVTDTFQQVGELTTMESTNNDYQLRSHICIPSQFWISGESSDPINTTANKATFLIMNN